MRYAICNETFAGWEHGRVCRLAAALGYQGLEIAPFTLGKRITDVSAEQRQELRSQAENCGLKLLGLHWLLARTEGLHVTATDESSRRRTAEYLIKLARCCRDLGGDILVFGSPAQRSLPSGVTKAQGTDFAIATFRLVLPALADLGVRLCLEPLTKQETDFINSCAEAVEMIERIDHPNFVLHLDVKAMASEGVPIPDLIRRYARYTGHFHANDPNKRGPGFGEVDFVPIFQALKASAYTGWISVEVFDYSPDPETIARESIQYMSECERVAGGSAY
jgi:sugar phosphate isomerase/epimerase